MKICIGIPSPAWIHPDFALRNLPQIVAYSKDNIKDLELFIDYKQGVMTSSNRNFILKRCLEENIDGILWLDSDMIYPPDILVEFIKSDKDIIAPVYFKRSEPHDPIVYLRGGSKETPYQIVDVTKIKGVTEVDGVGFGGMFVKTSVYKALGDEKWMHYGRNFGIPIPMEDQMSHDLVFCETAKKHGFKVHVHGGIHAIHIGDKMVEMKDWIRRPSIDLSPKTIAVVIPSINIERANMVVDVMQKRAGRDADYYVVEDIDRSGFMATMNDFVKNNEYDYYVYAAEDSFPGWMWLKRAYDKAVEKDAGLIAFNDGKNSGNLATFGMVERKWMESIYGGDIFYSGYHSHYGDTELTVYAIRDNKLAYDPEACLVEVDYKKHGVNIKDKELYNKRKMTLFNSSLQELFS